MILFCKTQVRIRFETCNLRLDRCELTLKSADVPTLAWQQLLFLAFHRRTPPSAAMPSLSLRLMLGSIAGDNSAPKLCLFFAGLSDLGLTCLSDSQQSGNDFLTSVYVARWAEWVKGQGTADDAA